MQNDFFSPTFDLVTPDGYIQHIHKKTTKEMEATVLIENISRNFVGYQIDRSKIFFNLKSTLAQVGIDSESLELELSYKFKRAQVKILLQAIDPLGETLLEHMEEGAFIGKLFAEDDRRLVRNPEYLSRMFGRSDRRGKPLLSLGGMQGSTELILEKIDGRTVAFLRLKSGVYRYEPSMKGFVPALAKALKDPKISLREILRINQVWFSEEPKFIKESNLLLVRTLPLHIRTVFGRVVNKLLPEGIKHTSASVLQPDTEASGDVYELFGRSQKELVDIPLEFYALEPYREHVFFTDRDQLQECLDNPETLFNAFKTAPKPTHHKCAAYIVKGSQLLELQPTDWIIKEAGPGEFPGVFQSARQAMMAERYIQAQPSYPFLKAIEDGAITSQGILLSRFFPSPLMKRLLLSENVHYFLKGIYFQKPSRSFGDFFSHEDRTLLIDLAKFGIPVFWVDEKHQTFLQYIPKPEKDTGMFVPPARRQEFQNATMIGVYGSNLKEEQQYEDELIKLLEGLLHMRYEMNHPLLNSETPLALLTGGGPGVMSLGNRVAKKTGILSCANIVDFASQAGKFVHEQHQNPFIEAKMTYRLDRLVERQAEFNLDLPILVEGGIGTDFEQALEEVRRKVGVSQPTPVILFGNVDYWKSKITSRFQCNLKAGTIVKSEWISNCFYCAQTSEQALEVYRKFFAGQLQIGPGGPIYQDGFVSL
ncbi:MAG: LOG family protein [Simkaniaceae bacterium]